MSNSTFSGSSANGGAGGGLGSASGGSGWGRANGLNNATSSNNASDTRRRPSLSTTLTHPSHHNGPSSSSFSVSTPHTTTPGAYQPPHAFRDTTTTAISSNTTPSASNKPTSNFKYSTDDMFGIYDQMRSRGELTDAADGGVRARSLMLSGSAAGDTNGGGSGWGDRGSGSAAATNEVCWERGGGLEPVTLNPMTAEEKELFANVNSPVPAKQQHQNPNTPGGPNSTGGNGPQHAPRPSTSTTNLNSNYHKSNQSTSSIGTGSGGPGGSTASPTTRRPRRETLEQGFPAAGNRGGRRTELRNSADDQTSSFDRFQPRNDDNRRNDDEQAPLSARPSNRFGRTTSTGWGNISSPVTPGGSASAAFQTGAFGGTASFNLRDIMPGAKSEDKTGGSNGSGSIGRSTGRRFNNARTLEENENENSTRADARADDESNYQQQRIEQSQQQQYQNRDEYDARPNSAETDPFYRRDSLQPGDLDVEDPTFEPPHRNITPSMVNQNEYFNGASPSGRGPRGNNLLSTPTRIGAQGGFGGGGIFNQNSQLNSPMAGPGTHTPSSGFHTIQTQHQMGGNQELQDGEPLSPSDTNPYHSPLPEREDAEGDERSQGDFRRLGDEGSQTSSHQGQMRLSGLGSISSMGDPFGAVLGTPGVWGTPGLGQQNSLLNNTPGAVSFNSSHGDYMTGSGGVSIFDQNRNSGGFVQTPGGHTRSRLADMFPAEHRQQMAQQQAMQQSPWGQPDVQRTTRELERIQLSDDNPSHRGVNRMSGERMYEQDQRERGISLSSDDPFRAQGMPQQQVQSMQPFPQLNHSGSIGSLPPAPGLPGPAAQVMAPGHIMVMPDKMKWTYRDPTGNEQGPFSGLEMHDWYKAGFFHTELMVKRENDRDYEQLGRVIARIGNSREPFLVPMQGPPPPPGSGYSGTGPWGTPVAVEPQGSVQPPFAGSFPSFGTTLTADQQNALERRKQEEQYLMARQREYLVQQQVISKQVTAAHHMSKISRESLQHQPSNHSLHSQMSLTNLQSPGGFQPLPPLHHQQSFGDNPLRHNPSAGSLDSGYGGNLGAMQSREDLQFQGGGMSAIGMNQGGFQSQPLLNQLDMSQAQTIERQRAMMERQYQAQHQQIERNRQQAQAMQQAFNNAGQPGSGQQQQGQSQHQQMQYENPNQVAAGDNTTSEQAFDDGASHDNDSSPHTEDIKQPYGGDEKTRKYSQAAREQEEPAAAAAAEAPEPVPQLQTQSQSQSQPQPSQPQSQTPAEIKNPWGAIPQHTGLPLPFPPPPASATSPAPEQRQILTRPPSVETPLTGVSASVAPWAKDTVEATSSKIPSLREIQALEAETTAARDAAAAEQRREQYAYEMAQATALAHSEAPAPGLPMSSTWGSGPTASHAASTALAWAKPMAKASTIPAQKTLTQIQKEEEVRKTKSQAQQALAASTAAALAPAGPSSARREWASKVATAAPAAQSAVGGVWQTVGNTPKRANVASPPTRTVGMSSPAPPASRPMAANKAPVGAPTATSTQRQALDELNNWCKASLRGLKPGVNVNDLLITLTASPDEVDLLAEIVYYSTTTVNGRQFATEFIKRRKAALQGVVISSSTDNASIGSAEESGRSWNQVAQKKTVVSASGSTSSSGGIVPGVSGGEFKVIQKKKKGGK